MTELRLNTSDIEHAGQQMRAKAAEMEDAIQSTENAINPMRDMVSMRISKDLEVWDSLRQKFSIELQELVEASSKVLGTARAFTEVDGG